MKTPRLKTVPSRLQPLPSKIQPLSVQSKRQSGRRWQETRMRVAVAGQFECVDCGRLWQPDVDHVDHDIPLEHGGSNDDGNLRLRCLECHKAKTAAEARQRAGGA